MHVHMHAYAYMLACTYICAYVCVHAYAYICMYLQGSKFWIHMYLYTRFAILVLDPVLVPCWHNISMPGIGVNLAYRLTIHPLYQVSMQYWNGMACSIWGGMQGYRNPWVCAYVLMHVCMENCCLGNPQMCAMHGKDGNSTRMIRLSGKWPY